METINVKKYERTNVSVDLTAVRHNLLQIKSNLPDNVKVMAVVKTDGYGHGAFAIAKYTQDIIDGYAVATAEEALSLRRHNIIDKMILILSVVTEAFYEELIKEIHGRKEVSFYDDKKMSLSKLYSVSSRLKEALDEKVWLKSGAYLIIQPTEALTVIDVNSGKIQKKHPGDDIYFTINKEAAKEIAFQLKLRNISGIIVVDFINQNKQEQDKELLHYFSALVKEDPVQTNVVGMTSLGLVEVTRKKVYRSLREQLI